jgi:urease accessory protein
MGAPATRITAADFVTPPELQHLRLAPHGAGRVGGVRLQLRAGRDRTILGECYQQVPLRVLPPFQFAPTQPALLYLLNPTAGLMDGDAHLVDLTAHPGARALVTGQSATRIHPSVQGFATQQWHVRVEAGALLALLPGPAIPFRGCRYYQRTRLDLAVGAGVLWGDVWLAGRYARGGASELFQFATLVQDLSVCSAGRLVFRDRFCWEGPWDRDTAAWHFGDGLACGSLFASGPVTEDLVRGPAAAAFPTAHGDTCVRWYGPPEAVMAAVVQATLRVAAARAGTAWLRPEDLAPVHWFSAPADRV